MSLIHAQLREDDGSCMYVPQSMNVPLTFAGGRLHDEVDMVLPMSREGSGDVSDKTEVEIRGC